MENNQINEEVVEQPPVIEKVSLAEINRELNQESVEKVEEELAEIVELFLQLTPEEKAQLKKDILN